jgi:hypothetical protein
MIFPIEPKGTMRRLLDAQKRRQHLYVVSDEGRERGSRMAAVRLALRQLGLRCVIASAIVGYGCGGLVMLGEIAGKPIIPLDVPRAFLIGISMGLLTWVFAGAQARLFHRPGPTTRQEEETDDAAV